MRYHHLSLKVILGFIAFSICCEQANSQTVLQVLSTHFDDTERAKAKVVKEMTSGLCFDFDAAKNSHIPLSENKAFFDSIDPTLRFNNVYMSMTSCIEDKGVPPLEVFNKQEIATKSQWIGARLSSSMIEQSTKVGLISLMTQGAGDTVVKIDDFCIGEEDPSPSIKISKRLWSSNEPLDIFQGYKACIESDGKVTDSIKAKLDEPAKNAISKKEEQQNFAGFNWGVGIAKVSMKDKVVEEISMVNNTISIDYETDQKAKLMLETHYLFPFQLLKRDMGVGPFLSIGVSDVEKDVFSNLGFGVMWGTKYENSSKSFNISFGRYYDFDAKVLKPQYADGMSTLDDNGEALVTDSNALLQRINMKGWMLMFSSSF